VFERLAAAMGRTDLLADERFRDNAARAHHREELDRIISGWMAARTEQEILGCLEESGAVAGPVYDTPRILADPQYAAREDIITVRDPALGDLRMVGVVPKFSATPGEVSHAGPALGEHNHEIYGTWLGLDDEALARLAEEGVI
jgi:formyl-CoA transferase